MHGKPRLPDMRGVLKLPGPKLCTHDHEHTKTAGTAAVSALRQRCGMRITEPDMHGHAAAAVNPLTRRCLPGPSLRHRAPDPTQRRGS